MPTAYGTQTYTEAKRIQKLLLSDIENGKTKPTTRATLARAWCELEERKRILRGRPLPGQLRPVAPAKPKRRRQPPILEAPLEAPMTSVGEAAGEHAPAAGEADSVV